MAKTIAWTDQAKADLRAIDRETALDLLQRLARFLATEQGDVRRLQDVDPPEFRLRYNDHGESIEILRVLHRRDAYR